MRLPISKRVGVVAMVLGLAGLSILALDTPFRFLGFGLGLPPLVVALGLLGNPGRYARTLHFLEQKVVRVEVWGQPLPGCAGPYRVDSIVPMGLGLWIYLQPVEGGPRLKLKIAQPASLDVQQDHAEIGFAGYVQWASKRVRNSDGQRAPGKVLVMLEIENPST